MYFSTVLEAGRPGQGLAGTSLLGLQVATGVSYGLSSVGGIPRVFSCKGTSPIGLGSHPYDLIEHYLPAQRLCHHSHIPKYKGLDFHSEL
jgi:hypothetical protein